MLHRRHANAHIVIRPARVQGDNAATEIVRALRTMAKVPGIDVIIVGRGGGSAEDLQAFNEEVLARAIVASPVPIISAVGHEVDFTIADFVADFRAPTPSAAAEVILSARDDCRARVASLKQSLDAAVRAQLQRRRNTAHRLRLSLEARDVRRQLAAMRGRLTSADGRMAAAVRRIRERAETRFRVLVGRLDNLSPLAILARGYAVCWNEDRTAVISRADTVSPGDRVRVTLHEGELQCDVRKVD